MPDPKRYVAGTVAMLRRMGMSTPDALDTMLAVSEYVRVKLLTSGYPANGWVADVYRLTLERYADTIPSQPTSEESDYGDGSGSG